VRPGVSGVLVAGVGNVFLRDDGFGPAVARRLAEEVSGLPGWAPEEVQVRDYGIRGLHLAYDLLDGVDALVLVDVLPAPADGSTSAVTLRIKLEVVSSPLCFSVTAMQPNVRLKLP